MSQKYNYSEMIDTYLEGKMSEEQMRDFEHQLKKDPIMENEFQLQKDIVSSLKDYRKAELKARLDGINVGSPWFGTGFNAVNISLSVVLTSLIGAGIFFYTTTNDNELNNAASDVALTETVREGTPKKNVPSAITAKPDTPSAQPKGPETAKTTTPAMDDEGKAVNKEPSLKKTKENNANSSSTGHSVKPSINQPHIVEFKNDNTVALSDPITLPKNTLSSPSITSPVPLEVEKKEDKKHHFHYQYYNSKLYLYGNFKNIPYELIELNNDSGKRLYMYYEDNFYFIQDNSVEITPLEKIVDSVLISNLNALKIKK